MVFDGFEFQLLMIELRMLFESKVGLYSNRGSDMENVPTQSVLLIRCDTFSMLVYNQLVYHVGQWRMQDTGFSLGIYIF